MDDESYESIFVPIIAKVMETFQPSAVVLQCGADSLTGDRLGCFNLTVRGKLINFLEAPALWTFITETLTDFSNPYFYNT